MKENLKMTSVSPVMTLILGADYHLISSNVRCVQLACIDSQDEKAVKSTSAKEKKHVITAKQMQKNHGGQTI